jgi:hypothetical protein
VWLSCRWNPTDILHALSASALTVSLMNLYYIARLLVRSHDSSIGIATGYELDDHASIPSILRLRPRRLWSPPSLLSSGYRWAPSLGA